MTIRGINLEFIIDRRSSTISSLMIKMYHWWPRFCNISWYRVNNGHYKHKTTNKVYISLCHYCHRSSSNPLQMLFVHFIKNFSSSRDVGSRTVVFVCVILNNEFVIGRIFIAKWHQTGITGMNPLFFQLVSLRYLHVCNWNLRTRLKVWRRINLGVLWEIHIFQSCLQRVTCILII